MISNLKLYAIVAAIIALLAGLAWGARIIKKADKFDAAEKALSAERIAHKSDLEKIKSDLAASIQQREALQKGLTEIARRFNQPAPPAKTLVKYVEKPGETCPRASVSDDFVMHYNAASAP